MNSNDFKKQLAKLRRNKKFLWLGILFLVLIILWILVSIFATTKTSTISQELRDSSKSFVPRLESKVFDEIADKRAFSDQELAKFSIFVFGKNEMDSTTTPIDIMAIKSVNSSFGQGEELENIEPGSGSEPSPNPDLSPDLESTPEAELPVSENASASPAVAPQSVNEFLDFMKANY